ncbi:MAG: hypothetical protein Q9191_003940 [Dirinaria sp. TL-2023a]
MNTTHLDSSRPVFGTPELNPRTPLLPFISDAHLLLLLPTGAYWAYGLLFHWIDTRGYLARYKLHTPAEILKRNKVPMSKVISSILFYQVTTTLLGFWMLRGSEPDLQGDEARDIALWALWLSQVRKLLGLSGWTIWRDATIDSRFAVSFGSETETGDIVAVSMPDLTAAKTIYYFLVPLAQFALAIFIADTWQYFTHRIVHTNQYLYNNFHSVHHRVYIPYAFGAFYSNFWEEFIIDGIGTYLAIGLPRLSTRQALLFATLSTLKSVHDHCGYSIPWHPFEVLTCQNAIYHDIHHQSWGIKLLTPPISKHTQTNYSQLYTTFWDRALGTIWTGDVGALQKRYDGVTEVDVGRKWVEWFGTRGKRSPPQKAKVS